jgi:hypothetical protein
MAVENTLAYYDTAAITLVKSFILQAPGAYLLYICGLAYHRPISAEGAHPKEMRMKKKSCKIIFLNLTATNLCQLNQTKL